MSGTPRCSILTGMARFLLHHSHEARECRVAFAAWKGFESPLRHRVTIGSCLAGGHEIWWKLEAATEQDALAHLPRYLAERTEAIPISDIQVP
jgi:hypothetical protein